MISIKERIEYLDIAKGIGIILVVIGHLPIPDNNWFKIVIYSFHMPLFFLISGYFFNYEKYSLQPICQFTKRLNKLIIPYLLFNIFFILYIAEQDYLQKFYTVIYGIGVKYWTWDILPMWFIPTLFLSEIGLFLFIKLTRDRSKEFKMISLLIVASIGYFVTRYFSKGYHLPWSIDLAILSTPFLYIGFLFKKENLLRRPLSYASLIIALIITAQIIILNGKVDMNGRIFNNIYMFYIGGLTGSYLTISVSKLLNDWKLPKKVLALLGKNSMYIMSFHLFAVRILLNNVNQKFPKPIEYIQTHFLIGSFAKVVWEICFSLFVALIIHILIKLKNTKFLRPKPVKIVAIK